MTNGINQWFVCWFVVVPGFSFGGFEHLLGVYAIGVNRGNTGIGHYHHRGKVGNSQ